MLSKTFISGFARWAVSFFAGLGLPLFIGACVLIYEMFLLAVVFAPDSWGVWASFSEEFKIWCFSYDPRTGYMEWAEVWVMLLEPLFVLAIALAFAWSQLGTLAKFSTWRRHYANWFGGITIASISLGVFVYWGSPGKDSDTSFPFPGQRIRTAIIPPSIQLVDQKGNPFDLEDLKGDVVVITGVYALCYSTCPQILVRLGALYNDLDPADRERVKFVALTLNPEGETTELMNAFVTGYGFEYPQFRYLNGDPDHMRELLKQLQFSSFVNPETGLIDHVNLFLLLDRNGEIAYRLTLDARHSSWLTAALGELIDETRELDKALVVN